MNNQHVAEPALIEWEERGQIKTAKWQSEAGLPVPVSVLFANERTGFDEICAQIKAEGHVLWQGDYPRARQLLQQLGRWVERLLPPLGRQHSNSLERFEAHRCRQGQRAAHLARFLVPLSGNYRLPLRRGQEVAEACEAAWGPADGEPRWLALRELLAVVSAYEWQKKGVPIPCLAGRIYPRYGVFSPVRGEYLELVASAPLKPQWQTAIEIGVGTGVLSALLAKRGLQVVATDISSRALACAAENLEKLGLTAQVRLVVADMFPQETADLLVCNPPWVPAQPSSPIEYAVYDPDSSMLKAFLNGVLEHLAPEGEAWLILSDLAEHLGLRPAGALLGWIEAAGLCVKEKLDIRPSHPKASDPGDPLSIARAAEVTSLWRLVRR